MEIFIVRTDGKIEDVDAFENKDDAILFGRKILHKYGKKWGFSREEIEESYKELDIYESANIGECQVSILRVKINKYLTN